MPVYLLHGFVFKLLSKIKFSVLSSMKRRWPLCSAFFGSCIFLKPLVEFLAPLFRWNRQDFDRRGRKK